jgi:hypothetical protein
LTKPIDNVRLFAAVERRLGDSPGKDKESNWLPAPNGLAYLIMRLYSPKDSPPSILPPGDGTWKPPGIVAAK